MNKYNESVFQALSGLVPSGAGALPKKGSAKFKLIKKLSRYYRRSHPTYGR